MTQPNGWRSAVSEFREREFCAGRERATWESSIIPLSLFRKDVLADVGVGGSCRQRIGWARAAVAHQSPRRSPLPSPRVTQTRFDVCRERGSAGAERPASLFNEALCWSSSGRDNQRQKLSSRCRCCWVITPLIAGYVTLGMVGNWHLEPDYLEILQFSCFRENTWIIAVTFSFVLTSFTSPFKSCKISPAWKEESG